MVKVKTWKPGPGVVAHDMTINGYHYATVAYGTNGVYPVLQAQPREGDQEAIDAIVAFFRKHGFEATRDNITNYR